MTYLLDTNVWVDYLHRGHPGVTRRLHATEPEEVWLSSVVLAELRYGADKSQFPRRNHALLDALEHEVGHLSFDASAAQTFGNLRTDLERRGIPIGPYDMLIASQALSHGFVLVTDNLREFGRIDGLHLENWRNPALS